MVVGVEAAAGESGCIAWFFEFGTDTGRLQDHARLVDHVLRNQNTAGQDTERTFHHAHVLIDHQVFDAGLAQEGLDKRDQHKVVGSDEFFHVSALDAQQLRATEVTELRRHAQSFHPALVAIAGGP